jgi:endonuclease/exonuclease/phosphatase family metal-dependent hydrolase
MKRLLTLFLVSSSLTVQAALTIGAYNIRNFDYDQRYNIRTNKSELAKIMKSTNFDVLSVEEVVNSAEFERFVARELPGFDTEISRCGGEHGQHLGFVFNKDKVELLSFNEDLSTSNPGGQPTCDGGSRPLAIGLFQVKATGQRFYGITAHLKSGSQSDSQDRRIKQYEIIKNTINELRNKTGVKDFYFAGDLNTTNYLVRGPDYTSLTKVVKDLGMIALSQNLACSAYWWGGSDDGIETPSLLDHVIATPGLITNGNSNAKVHGHCATASCREVPAKELGVSYGSVSDHCPVTATIQ